MILCDSDAAMELQFFAAQTMRKKVCYTYFLIVILSYLPTPYAL